MPTMSRTFSTNILEVQVVFFDTPAKYSSHLVAALVIALTDSVSKDATAEYEPIHPPGTIEEHLPKGTANLPLDC